MRILIAVLPIIIGGCVALPIPYESVDNSTVKGRVLNASTSLPIVGLKVQIGELGTNRAATVTDSEGRFEILPQKKNHIWAIYPLAPIDLLYYCSDVILIYGQSEGKEYSPLKREITSCRWPFGRSKNIDNLDIVNDLGDVQMLMLPENG